MTKLLFLTLLFLALRVTGLAIGPEQPIAITEISKVAFAKGILPIKFHKDAAIKKVNGEVLLHAKCARLKDVVKNGDYYEEYKYIGDWPENHRLHVVDKVELNGHHCVIVDCRKGCKSYLLNGTPYLSKGMLINFNESETTDLQGGIYIWKITPNELKQSGYIRLPGNQQAREVRFSADGSHLLFQDMTNRFWSVKLS